MINTCTVTGSADRDALRLARRISRRNPAARLVVTGCLASRAPEAVLKEAPGALLVGNEGKGSLPELLGCGEAASAGVRGLSGRSRALVKVQDGCDGACSYCVVPSVRPILSSKPAAQAEAEVRGLLAGGYAEVVLCGVRLGRYAGDDSRGGTLHLSGLLERLARLPGDFRVRLSSLDITEMTDELLEVVAGSAGKICPSFHLPLQSGSGSVLKRMRRPYTADFYARRVEALRKGLPSAGLFADVMAGFPGETEAEHEESLRFVENLGFSGLHVFRYSKRAATPAATLPGQVPEGAKLERARRMRALDLALRAAFAARAVGGVRRALVEDGSPSGEALTEDFLTVFLEPAPGPGLRRVRVIRSEGPAAYAVPI